MLIEPSDLEEEGRTLSGAARSAAGFSQRQRHAAADLRFPRWPWLASGRLAGRRAICGSNRSNVSPAIWKKCATNSTLRWARQRRRARAGGVHRLPDHGRSRAIAQIFGRTRLAAAGRLHFPIGRLKSGFRLVPEGITLVSGGELFHRTDLESHRRGAGWAERSTASSICAKGD